MALTAAVRQDDYPALGREAVSYTWRQLAGRAGVSHGDAAGTGFEAIDVCTHYAMPEAITQSKPGIVVVPASTSAWRAILNRPPNSLDWLPLAQVVPPAFRYRLESRVPVLFWGSGYENGAKRFAEKRADGTVVFYADIIAASFLMLSRWEEKALSENDQHGRFPATASVAYRQNFLDRPIVDEYALILQAWIRTLLPGWTPRPRKFAVKLSHDIDFVRSASWRRVGGDLLKRRNPIKAAQTLHQMVSPKTDPYLRGCYELADLSEQHGFQSAFYFMSARPSRFDVGYDPRAKSVSAAIQALRRRGHEIGFHPGYTTFKNPSRFMTEKQRMDTVLGEKPYGGRQHYLRFRAPDTWRLWEAAGLSYDSTVGYADHDGFRCGTCLPYRPFDVEENRQLDLLEIPLIVMEASLREYRGLTPEEGKKLILALAVRCQRVGGVFSLLWHNTSLYGEWEPWAAIYRQILPHLAELERSSTPQSGPTGEPL